MIEAKELRIGNWFYPNEENNSPWQIQIIYHDKVGFDKEFTDNSDGWAKSIEDIQPIPLTPDVLIRCGFEKDGFGAYNISITNTLQASTAILSFASDYLYLRHKNNGNPYDDSICTLWNKDLMKEFYLHQLMNLYYFLTGKELDYKHNG